MGAGLRPELWRAGRRPEIRQRDVILHVFEHHFQWHADSEIGEFAFDDLAKQEDMLFELDDRGVVGKLVGEPGVLRTVVDVEGVQDAASARRSPLDVRRGALPATAGLRFEPGIALRTTPQDERVLRGGIPVAAVIEGDFRNRAVHDYSSPRIRHASE